MPTRRTVRRTRRTRHVRRYGLRAAVVGGAQLVYEAGKRVVRRVGNLVERTRRTGGLVRYGSNFVKQASKGYIGKAIMGAEGGDYNQFCAQTINVGKKKKSTVKRLAREMHFKAECTIYRWNGTKAFTGNGYYWLSRETADATYAYMPVFAFDLTAANNYINNAYSGAVPFYRLWLTKATGAVTWTPYSGLQADGISSAVNLQNETYAYVGNQINQPMEKSKLLWNQVKMNLWGAKNKAVKFTIQIVTYRDSDLDPLEQASGRAMAAKHNAYWQTVLKPLTFNPAATSGEHHTKGRVKILKQYTKIIQPTSSTENDSDPHVHMMKMFLRWDKLCRYDDQGVAIGTYDDLSNQADYAIQQQTFTNYLKSDQRIWLIIKATAFAENATPVNTLHGSFDLSIRTCHEPV